MNIFRLSLFSFCFFLFCISASAQLPLNAGVNILSPRFFPGWQVQNVGHPFVFYDSTSRHYKMYYAGSSSTQVNESLWDQWVTGLVTSSNALNWQYPDNYEPVLFARKFFEGEVVDPKQEAARFDAIFAIDAFVLKDGPLYKCWYTGWNGDFTHDEKGLSKKINYRIGYATSDDGYKWTKIDGNAGAGSVLGTGTNGEAELYGSEDPFIIKENGIYRMWYTGFDGHTRRILYATSHDGINWDRKGIALATGTKGQADELATQNPVVIKRNGQYELWYQGEGTATPSFHTLRAVSKDGVSWKKSGEVTLHPPTPKPSWPWTSLSSAGTEKTVIGNIIVQPDQSCQLFYSRQFTGERKATYGVITAPLSFIYTERINP
jgi:hypothetical protein